MGELATPGGINVPQRRSARWGRSPRASHAARDRALTPRIAAPSRSTASRPCRFRSHDAVAGWRPASGTRGSDERTLAGSSNPPEVATPLDSAWHTRSGRRARRRLAHSMRAHAAVTAVRIRECVLVGLREPLQRCALILLRSPRPRRGGVGLRHSIWRDERRFPVGLPRHAATRAALGSYTPFRPFGCGLPPSAGLSVRSCRSPRHSGAVAVF
jgi:hypothetical protein